MMCFNSDICSFSTFSYSGYDLCIKSERECVRTWMCIVYSYLVTRVYSCVHVQGVSSITDIQWMRFAMARWFNTSRCISAPWVLDRTNESTGDQICDLFVWNSYTFLYQQSSCHACILRAFWDVRVEWRGSTIACSVMWTNAWGVSGIIGFCERAGW